MDKKQLSAVVEHTRGILKEHELCDHCLGRMFAGRLGVVAHKRLGARIRARLQQNPPKTCYICKNLMSGLDTQVGKMIEASKEYQFSTFLIGAILQPSIHDRDDIIRSKFRLRGIASIKSDTTREMGKLFSRRTRSVVDYQNPDMVFTVDFKKDYCEIKPKAVLLQARYTKSTRGLAQKQKPCDNCEGRGCFVCEFHGIKEFDSVEGKIAKFFIEKFGAQQAKITWLGSEDESSLVTGNGRPIFIRLVNPHRRSLSGTGNVDLGGVSIKGLRTINKIPSDPVKFRTVVEMEIGAEGEVDDLLLDKLRNVRRQQVVLSDSPRKQKKMIYKMAAKKESSNLFKVRMESDGGIPLKRFVAGQEAEPSISGMLGTSCKCIRFDFHKITVTR